MITTSNSKKTRLLFFVTADLLRGPLLRGNSTTLPRGNPPREVSRHESGSPSSTTDPPWSEWHNVVTNPDHTVPWYESEARPRRDTGLDAGIL